jgi:hypothetical protein
MKIPSNPLVDVVVFGAMILVALGGLAYGWWHWRTGFAAETLSFWRRTVAGVGLSLVTLQAGALALLWVGVGSSQAYRLAPLFLAAIPCVFAGKGASRWWLLCSCILLFIVSFSTMIGD